MFSEALRTRAKRLLKACEGRGLTIAAAESCTGGLIAALLTEIPGSSSVFERGFVTYSNAAKSELLGVASGLIERHGAVSEEVAAAMARGALKGSGADIAVAVTGIAGPGGGTAVKPVGLVYVAVAGGREKPFVQRCRFTGGRSQVRLKAASKAVSLLSERSRHYP